jgi:hypothetical protein
MNSTSFAKRPIRCRGSGTRIDGLKERQEVHRVGTIHVQLLEDGAAREELKVAESVTKAQTRARDQPSQESV